MRRCPMIDVVLQRLERLQAELADLDPSHEIDATAQVAAMTAALRDVMVQANKGRWSVAIRAEQVSRRVATR